MCRCSGHKKMEAALGADCNIYKIKDTSLGEITSFVREMDKVMRDQNSHPSDIAETFKGIYLSIEVYRHYGLDLLKMKENGEEHDWGICKKEDAARGTGDMAGFGMGQSQRIIIDYDKDYGWALVRRYVITKR